MTVVGPDKRVIEGTETGGGGLAPRLIGYMEKVGQDYDRPTDPYVGPMTAKQNVRYGFPEDAVGNLLFKRVFVLKNPRMEVIETLAKVPAYKLGLVRIEIRGPKHRGVEYVFGGPDGRANLVMPDGSVVPVPMDRLKEMVAHLMGNYSPTR